MTEGLHPDLEAMLRQAMYDAPPVRHGFYGVDVIAKLRQLSCAGALVEVDRAPTAIEALTGIPLRVDPDLAPNQLQIRNQNGTVVKDVWL